jgi:hypothetical protein
MTELQEKCLSLANTLANEINGDLFYVPDEDVEQLLSKVTKNNVKDVAYEIAQLASWYN